jgi:hypothetical protein
VSLGGQHHPNVSGGSWAFRACRKQEVEALIARVNARETGASPPAASAHGAVSGAGAGAGAGATASLTGPRTAAQHVEQGPDAMDQDTKMPAQVARAEGPRSSGLSLEAAGAASSRRGRSPSSSPERRVRVRLDGTWEAL